MQDSKSNFTHKHKNSFTGLDFTVLLRSNNKRFSYRLETGRQLCISLQLSYYLYRTANKIQLCQDACDSSTCVDARPHCCLTPPFQRIPSNNCINLISPETRVPAEYLRAYSMGLSLLVSRNYFPKSHGGKREKSARKQNLTRNSQSRSFKVTHFAWIAEKPTTNCVNVYSNVGLVSILLIPKKYQRKS